MTQHDSLRLSAEGNEHLRNFTDRLFRGEAIGGIRYANSVVSGPGVNDTFDPEVVFEPRIAAGYWPGDGLEGHSYAATALAELPGINPDDERIALRKLILGAYIGEAALARYQYFVSTNPLIEKLKQTTGGLLVPTMLELCSTQRIPFTFMVSASVVKSEVIPIGDTAAHIYYPVGISPKTALANIRQSVLQAQQNETP